MIEWIADAVLVVLMVTVAVTDVARGKIYNWATYPAALIGLALWTIAGAASGGLSGGLKSLGWAWLGLLTGFVPMMIVFYLGGIGGGDAKLAGALGALLGGPMRTLYAMAYCILLAAVAAAVVMIGRRVGRQTMGRLWRFFWVLCAGGRPISPSDGASPRIATALPWAIGTIWMLVETRLFHGWRLLNWAVGG